jgi:hypothetical protein
MASKHGERDQLWMILGETMFGPRFFWGKPRRWAQNLGTIGAQMRWATFDGYFAGDMGLSEKVSTPKVSHHFPTEVSMNMGYTLFSGPYPLFMG